MLYVDVPSTALGFRQSDHHSTARRSSVSDFPNLPIAPKLFQLPTAGLIPHSYRTKEKMPTVFAKFGSLTSKTKNAIVAGGLTGFCLSVYYYHYDSCWRF